MKKTNSLALALVVFLSLLLTHCRSSMPFSETDVYKTILKEVSATPLVGKKDTLAILAFSGGDSDGEIIASSLTRQPALREVFSEITLVTRSTVAAMIFDRRDSWSEYANVIFELGRELNASFVIAGRLTKFAGSNIVLAGVMDVENRWQIAGDYRMYNAIEEIDALIPDIAKKLAASVSGNNCNLPGLLFPPFDISEEANQNDAMVLAQILACDLANGNKFAVMPVADMDRVNGREGQYVLSGSVQKLGTLNKFSADVYDALNGTYITGKEEAYRNSEQGFELIPRLAARLTGSECAPRHLKAALEKFELDLSVIKEAEDGSYTITLKEDIILDAPIDFSGFGKKIITIKGHDRMRIITNSSNGLFSVPPDLVLILGNNITLNGNSRPSRVVEVMEGGKFEMRNGSFISGSAGGGVLVSGAFTMSGGAITGNKGRNGAGVFVSGVFTMTGGSISGNTAEGSALGSEGGGVYVSRGGTFSMTGGNISANSSSKGGGVYFWDAAFRKTGGTIDGSNKANNGTSVAGGYRLTSPIQTQQGANGMWDHSFKRGSAAGPSVNLDSREESTLGGWEG